MDKKIELIDENGDKVIFSVIADFKIEGEEYSEQFEGNEYAVLGMDGASFEEGLLFRVVDNDDESEPTFTLIEDDEEFEIAAEFYNKLMNEDE